MGKLTWSDYVRGFIGSIAWKVFLWSIGSTAEEYWKDIQMQEETVEEGE